MDVYNGPIELGAWFYLEIPSRLPAGCDSWQCVLPVKARLHVQTQAIKVLTPLMLLLRA